MLRKNRYRYGSSGRKISKARLQNRSLAPLTGAFQSFRPAPRVLLYGSSAGGDFKCPGLLSSLMGDEFARSIVHVVCGEYGNCSVINFVSSELKLFVFFIKRPTFSLPHDGKAWNHGNLYAAGSTTSFVFCRSCYPEAPPEVPRSRVLEWLVIEPANGFTSLKKLFEVSISVCTKDSWEYRRKFNTSHEHVMSSFCFLRSSDTVVEVKSWSKSFVLGQERLCFLRLITKETFRCCCFFFFI